jgi:hypothetical protein
LEHWSIGALEHWNIGALEHWSIGTLEHWSIRALEHWSIRALEHWSIRALEHWNFGAFEHWNIRGALYKTFVFFIGVLELLWFFRRKLQDDPRVTRILKRTRLAPAEQAG